jgi:hypothetical protein
MRPLLTNAFASAMAHADFLDALDDYRQTGSPQRYGTLVGTIAFYPVPDPAEVCIYYVSVTRRREGIFTDFLRALVADPSVRIIRVLAVGTEAMVACLRKFGAFVDKGGDFTLFKIHVE